MRLRERTRSTDCKAPLGCFTIAALSILRVSQDGGRVASGTPLEPFRGWDDETAGGCSGKCGEWFSEDLSHFSIERSTWKK
jgi:hypothetical protein